MMLSVPLFLAIGLSGSGARIDIRLVNEYPDYEEGRFSVNESEIEPDDLPVL